MESMSGLILIGDALASKVPQLREQWREAKSSAFLRINSTVQLMKEQEKRLIEEAVRRAEQEAI